MNMDHALETIDAYCDKLNYTNIGENQQKLHENLRKLNNLVWADDFDTRDLLKLALEIYEVYDSIPDKGPYTDIMKVVHYFEKFFARRAKIELAPSKFRISGMYMASLLRQLRLSV